jgi:serine/threonine-protein kinase
MKTARFKELERLFEQAVDLDEPERQRFIDRLAQRNEALAVRLQAMLAADADGDDKLRDAVGHAARASGTPTRIGPFEVLGKLGEGGMGVVYLCRRETEDFDQLLAVKRLGAAIDSDLARQRLAIERRVLASLRHPNIGQFVDGGEDVDGTPFVAMEYVDGLPIDRYAAERSLGRAERIRLFLALCQAVQFAHRNLIVHRDIKMANVMIDANGRVKLLDFGIARLIGDQAESHDQTALTVAGAMTPLYASPEQVRGETATPLSDVDSLGVVLYELLAGRKPYEIKTRRPTEIERIICVDEPTPPLTDQRGRSGDLNSIVGMAIHKGPVPALPVGRTTGRGPSALAGRATGPRPSRLQHLSSARVRPAPSVRCRNRAARHCRARGLCRRDGLAGASACVGTRPSRTRGERGHANLGIPDRAVPGL